MLRNMLLVTYRNLIKNRTYTFINVLGLALGVAAFVMIKAYVNFERNYDHMNTDAASIYRVESQFYKGRNLNESWASATNGYAPAMKANFAEIASVTRIDWNSSERVVRYGDVKFREAHVCFADSNFFQFFQYKLLKGDAKTILNQVNTIAVSESAAKKYFGNTDPMGKFVEVSNARNTFHCMVTGVFADPPPNTTMRFSFLMSFVTAPPGYRTFWYMHENYTFVKLRPNASPVAVEAKFPALAERYKTGPAFKDLRWTIRLVPLTAIHLKAAKPYEVEAKGNANAVIFLNIIAFVILTIACVNYINLATTKAVDRAREIGIRKVNGARLGQLLTQFLMESGIINFMALILAAIFISFSIYYLPSVTGKSAAESLLFDWPLGLQIAAVLLSSMFLSGLYPAFVLARVNPVVVLKGRYTYSRGGVLLRKGMVAFQFTASLLLIAGTIAVYRQLNYMSTVNTGVNMEETFVIKAPPRLPDYKSKIRSFKDDLTILSGVKSVTGSNAVPGKAIGMYLSNRRFGASKNEERSYEMLRVDFDFIKAYNLQVIAGHAFDVSRPADSTGLILNETAVKQLGFASAQEAVGKFVWLETLETQPNQVIGVIKDYHQQSLQMSYTPAILFMDPHLGWIPTTYYSIKTNTAQTRQVVANIKATWEKYFPESSFDFFFLDDFYNRQYQQETQFGNTFMLFSSLAIMIACMGLFGLTAYTTARRTKEIGVRKVLGASVSHIISILTWDVIRLVIVCSFIAIPLAYILVSQWLNAYAFKAQLTFWQFIAPVAALIVITLATISYLTFRAALTNPVETLKDE